MPLCRILCLMSDSCMQFAELGISETAFTAFAASGFSYRVIPTYRIVHFNMNVVLSHTYFICCVSTLWLQDMASHVLYLIVTLIAVYSKTLWTSQHNHKRARCIRHVCLVSQVINGAIAVSSPDLPPKGLRLALNEITPIHKINPTASNFPLNSLTKCLFHDERLSADACAFWSMFNIVSVQIYWRRQPCEYGEDEDADSP